MRPPTEAALLFAPKHFACFWIDKMYPFTGEAADSLKSICWRTFEAVLYVLFSYRAGEDQVFHLTDMPSFSEDEI